MTFATGPQIAAARALLVWDQKDIAERVGVTVAAISKIEKGDNKGKASTLEKIQMVLELAGIEFLDGEGVRKKRNPIRVFKGTEGFNEFFDDVYDVAKNHPNPDICVTALNESEYVHWAGKDYAFTHRDRMTKLKRDPIRVLVKKDYKYDAAFQYYSFRLADDAQFANTSMYIYGHKSGFIEFEKDSLIITMVDNASIADGMRRLFNAIWNNAAQIDPQVN